MTLSRLLNYVFWNNAYEGDFRLMRNEHDWRQLYHYIDWQYHCIQTESRIYPASYVMVEGGSFSGAKVGKPQR
jgi:hypothetical protein